MAPPPAPNPHRFTTPKHSSSQAAPARPPQVPTSKTKPTSSQQKQFASTPRFSFSAARHVARRTSTAALPHGQFSSPTLPRRPLHLSRPHTGASVRSEEIEESGFDGDAEAEERKKEESVDHPSHHPPIRTTTTTTARTAETIDSAPPSPSPSPSPSRKKRRLRRDISISSSSPTPSPPTSSPPAATATTTTPRTRFILSPLSSSPTLQTHRPPLTLPRASSPEPPQPPAINALFSPRRRGRRFLPGGMAAGVRDWVLEVAAAHTSTVQKDEGREKEEWDQWVKVLHTEKGGLCVLAVEDQGEGVRWMFVGKGEGVMKRGAVVGVRGPVWEVEVQGKVWKVGVEWGVCG
ncbi:MAG: hypothetical protein LQ345_006335 [Seirophora villosa]|nr:MAG: hypothetical protein LQ345_006335 [Seirophora villosa]